MLGPLGPVTNSHWESADGQERFLFKEPKCYAISSLEFGKTVAHIPLILCITCVSNGKNNLVWMLQKFDTEWMDGDPFAG
jgi:hypothetical protein